jgi:hypothetical protein
MTLTPISRDDPGALDALRERAHDLEAEARATEQRAYAGECGGVDVARVEARLRRVNRRIRELEAVAPRRTAAREAGGVAIELRGEQAIVTFARKPDANTLAALKRRGFRWTGGSWVGVTWLLPDELRRAP